MDILSRTKENHFTEQMLKKIEKPATEKEKTVQCLFDDLWVKIIDDFFFYIRIKENNLVTAVTSK
jgi:hypothetical protein